MRKPFYRFIKNPTSQHTEVLEHVSGPIQTRRSRGSFEIDDDMHPREIAGGKEESSWRLEGAAAILQTLPALIHPFLNGRLDIRPPGHAED